MDYFKFQYIKKLLWIIITHSENKMTITRKINAKGYQKALRNSPLIFYFIFRGALEFSRR